MPYNPFANVRVTGTWEDHASYSAGGTDLPLGYGTVLPAPASGILRTSGGSGEWAAGWIGSAGRRSILSLDTPIHRHSPRRSSPYEALGPMVAIVFQHQSAFAGEGWVREGAAAGWSGASANGANYGGDVHLHWHGLDANGNRLRIESFLPSSSTAGGSITPIEEDDMYEPNDRKRDQETRWLMGQAKGSIDAIRAAVTRIEKNVAINKWALTDPNTGLRKQIAALAAEIDKLDDVVTDLPGDEKANG